MKAKKWGVSAIYGIIAFLLTFCFSIVNNTWFTSLFRAVIGFILFFMLGYIIRFVLRYIVSMKNSEQVQKTNPDVDSLPEAGQAVPSLEETNVETVFQSIPLQSLHDGKSLKN